MAGRANRRAGKSRPGHTIPFSDSTDFYLLFSLFLHFTHSCSCEMGGMVASGREALDMSRPNYSGCSFFANGGRQPCVGRASSLTSGIVATRDVRVSEQTAPIRNKPGVVITKITHLLLHCDCKMDA